MKISIGKAAKLLGVSQDTLRRWEREGKIYPSHFKIWIFGCFKATLFADLN